MLTCPDYEVILQSAKRIKPFIHRTPVLTCQTINDMCSSEVFFKCENFQKAGSFKYRGATNAVLSLSETEARTGVITQSSGNHAAAIALAAKRKGIKAFIVMPSNAAKAKISAVRTYGGEIHFCEPTISSREELADRLVREKGFPLIPPYNDYRIIAGQATAALELLEQVNNLDIIIAPVGGGGLLSGTALTASGCSQKIQVFGAEPQGADDAQRSFIAGKLIPQTAPNTIADGLLTSLGSLTFPIIQKYVHDIELVSEDSIITAMRFVFERMKIVIEPSSAVAVAPLIEQRGKFEGKRIGVILSGGNIDLDRLPWM
ncbi:MAG: pyridoxal-phosphate dependent enzyme [Desulfobacterales bacterium]|nr:pyridoxal-phosphate dependent enzyme [Deltaproteobacteria bacterium]NNK97089.1 pyridoxal-phosphate dependent enzyme [Desulfobacterales bacterium]